MKKIITKILICTIIFLLLGITSKKDIKYKEIIRDARQELSETRNIQVIKPCKQ